jgi:RNA polymerase sigma-70 factor (ECF subfamily)
MMNTAGGRRDIDLASDDGLRRAALIHGSELRAYAAGKLGSRSLAEDLVQETFLRAWRAADRFDPTRGTTRTWLFAILRNVIIDFARTQARRMAMSPVAGDATTSDASDAVVGSLVLHDAFRQLTAQHREVIFHGHVRERPHEEIAQLLGVPVGTVRSRLFYARQALKRALANAR